MSTELADVLDQINRRYLREHPASAARRLERLPVDQAVDEIGTLSPLNLLPMWPYFGGDMGAALLAHLPETLARDVLGGLLPTEAVRFLAAMDSEDRERLMALLAADLAATLAELMSYPEGTAGRLMDRRSPTFRPDLDAAAAMDALRRVRGPATRTVFVIDADNRLAGQVPLQTLALAMPETPLRELMIGVPAAVHAMDPRDEVVETAEKHRLTDLPVVDLDGRLIGVIPQDRLLQALQEEAAADIGAMVGVSPQERALSKPWFAVKKRLPWLQINLITAFLAAAVVGVFENTIAQFTALAVLLPVVAGQSGNAGAQALAVTMRGLALREVTARQWLPVAAKEVGVGLVNGLAIAATCGLGVYLWSGSIGLVLVIASSMVLAMVAAGFAGAAVPMVLTRMGQDPAQSSSIILTTVTDIAGFFSFLGIATLLSGLL
ncbi:magnesium transporter [Panacagrimonas sp.]|uniref:magnesium transporter n=1 Tax=Panacagrimonas sp. TaxID=2480088 RepID=UPI003B52DDFF